MEIEKRGVLGRCVEVLTGPFNGFSHTDRVKRVSPTSYSYTFDGTNYKQGLQIPSEGEFMLSPKDITENMHFYLFYNYNSRKRLNSFAFSYSHFAEEGEKFMGNRYEMRTESGQDKFKKMYETGLLLHKQEDATYNFVLNAKAQEVTFFLNQQRMAQFSAVSDAREPFLVLPTSRLT